jgi:hypothetical protein
VVKAPRHFRYTGVTQEDSKRPSCGKRRDIGLCGNAAAGFADQAHMSRAIRVLTGATPGNWRRSNSFKTAKTAYG